MKIVILATLSAVVLSAFALAQDNSAHKPLSVQKPDLERAAITNLRKLAIGESTYAMHHPQAGFACDPEALTTLEWPDSPAHAKLVDPTLLRGTGQYKFSAQCAGNSKPAGTLYIFAVPLDPQAGLRTFCATGTFGPYHDDFRTSEFPIRSIPTGPAEACLASGTPLQ